MRIAIASGMALLMAVSGAALASNGVAAIGPPPPTLDAGGSLSPAKLPRLRQAPVTLQMGFRAAPTEGQVPELDEISFEVARRVQFAPESWPQSCSLTKLYSPRVDARTSCAGSLIGHGSVASEITVPGQAPVSVTGSLLAFYALGDGRPRILAQVTTGEPLPLVYVIPFTMKSANGPYRTTVFVPRRRMRVIRGICVSDHPNCFAPSPYTLEGVYGHISEMTMSLHRVIRSGRRRISFVKGSCPLPPDFSTGIFPLLRVSLAYANGAISSGVVNGRCKSGGTE